MKYSHSFLTYYINCLCFFLEGKGVVVELHSVRKRNADVVIVMSLTCDTYSLLTLKWPLLILPSSVY